VEVEIGIHSFQINYEGTRYRADHVRAAGGTLNQPQIVRVDTLVD